ncbi:MAG TPA: glycerate kinase [Tepidisphaeraceae bacterium]|jgi:glycerate kinase
MKILLAPDKFKGSLTAPQIAQSMAAAIHRFNPQIQIDHCPMADGGEGTVAALVAATNGRLITRRVTGPLPEMKVDAPFGVLGDNQTAVIEMAAASGLALLQPEDRNPLNTTTFGTGELLIAAARMGVNHIILGIGGSATVDAGIGCAQACGLPVLLEDGEPVSPTEPLCGRDLPSVVLIKHGRGSPIDHCRITVACDVTNPLFGPDGAAEIFGPQKGATPQQVRWLDDALKNLATRTHKLQAALTPGAGAAGGLGFGILAFFNNSSLQSGAKIMIEATHLRARLQGVDLCITGEGRLDAQSLSGKAPIAVAQLCTELGIPCVAIVGSASPDIAASARDHGLQHHLELHTPPLPLEESICRAPELIEARTLELLQRFNP